MPKSINKDSSYRVRFIVKGTVQGVGFRPFVYNLAIKLNLTGFTQNTLTGVKIEVQGLKENIYKFKKDLISKAPKLSCILDLKEKTIKSKKLENKFEIKESSKSKDHFLLLPPDTAPCSKCSKEMLEVANRRYYYPFTNCTECGPRFSITKNMPYDRKNTTMSCFDLCKDCYLEYTSKTNRRFHAQPNACPSCGPKIWYVKTVDAQNNSTNLKNNEHSSNKINLTKCTSDILEGKIVAIKGLGGFLIACDANNEESIKKLRNIKNRPHKSLAIMVKDINAAKKIAIISKEEKTILESEKRPIVLCKKKQYSSISKNIAPDTNLIGIMLPSTPLHYILFESITDYYHSNLKSKNNNKIETPALIMTSGNTNGEPICLGNRDAFFKLKNIVDGFVFHDRDILSRIDDSVLATIKVNNKLKLNKSFNLIIRRARGYVPNPLSLPFNIKEPTLSLGADLKNTFCLSKKDTAFVSQHIGDLEGLSNNLFQSEAINHFKNLFSIEPKIIVHDLHPSYTSFNKAKDFQLPSFGVQHHIAHAFALLSEKKFYKPALVYVMDGNGYGLDQSLWGGEFFLIDLKKATYKRLARCQNLSLPGGEAATKEPWRIAHAFLLLNNLMPRNKDTLPWSTNNNLKMFDVLESAILKSINCPRSTSLGRLFDVISSICGFSQKCTYEGQAAIKLEALLSNNININAKRIYECSFKLEDENQPAILETNTLILRAFEDINNKVKPNKVSERFHVGLSKSMLNMATFFSKKYNIKHIGFTGGCFQNINLIKLCANFSVKNGLNPMFSELLPPNDASISYGQASYISAYLHNNPDELKNLT